MNRYHLILLTLSLLAHSDGAVGQNADGAADEAALQVTTTEGIAYFEQHVRPLLIRHCYECHSAEANEVKGGLLMRHLKSFLRRNRPIKPPRRAS